MKNLIIVIAHYHEGGSVHLHLKLFIEHIFNLCTRIVFVSTNLNEIEKEYLLNYCDVINIDNIGYDFWSYKVGIEYLRDHLIDTDELVIMNSSFVIFNPKKITNEFFQEDGFTGIKSLTQAHTIDFHAQSYFISFKGNQVVNSLAFNKWWESVVPISDKNTVILKYEIGMSQFFSKNGFNFKAIYKPTNQINFIAICRAISINHIQLNLNNYENEVKFNLNSALVLNPTHFMWDDLFEKIEIIKIELVKHNGSNQNLEPFINKLKLNNFFYYELLNNSLL
jgi:rhamnosyltransferase